MKKLEVLGMALICALFFVACSGSVTTANLEDMLLSSEIDEATYEPIEATSEFYTDTPEIYLTGTVDNAPEGTLVGAEWLYIQDGEEVFIDGADWETEDVKSSLLFSLSKPTEDWPIGDYKVNLYIDKEVVLTLSFNVVEKEDVPMTSVNTAEVSYLQLSSEIDEATYEPIYATNSFYVDSPIVYLTVVVENATPGQMARAEWFYVEGGDSVSMDQASVEIPETSSTLLFNYTMPMDGWPVGEYMVDVYIDECYMESQFFTVE